VIDLTAVFEQIPLLRHHSVSDFEINRLCGLTNHNYRLKNARHDWILRIPRGITNRYMDRRAEAVNTRIASQLGLVSDCLWRDHTGLSLTQTLRHTRSPTAEELTDQTLLQAIVSRLKTLHGHDEAFAGSTNLQALLERYYSLMPPTHQSLLQQDYQLALQKIASLTDRDETRVPSHNDLVLENILVDQQQCWFIDWEYSAMSSPYWDLATLCNAGNFTDEQCALVLQLYNEDANPAQPRAGDIDQLMDYRYLLQTLSHCWTRALALDEAVD